MYSRRHAVTAKNYCDIPTETYSNQPPKEFSESPDYVARRGKPEEFIGGVSAQLSVQDINI
jgi:hypothetical protein